MTHRSQRDAAEIPRTSGSFAAAGEPGPRRLAGPGFDDLAFETARLRVRPLCATDCELYLRLYTDAATMRFVGPPLAPGRARDSFRRALGLPRRRPPGQFLTILERHSGAPLGLCSVQRVEASWGHAEAGIMLLPAAHAQGYAREAFAALLTQLFARSALAEVRARISVEHVVAARTVASLGLSRCVESAPGDARPALQTWCMRRADWCHEATR